jgi:hypothetical protein
VTVFSMVTVLLVVVAVGTSEAKALRQKSGESSLVGETRRV